MKDKEILHILIVPSSRSKLQGDALKKWIIVQEGLQLNS